MDARENKVSARTERRHPPVACGVRESQLQAIGRHEGDDVYSVKKAYRYVEHARRTTVHIGNGISSRVRCKASA